MQAFHLTVCICLVGFRALPAQMPRDSYLDSTADALVAAINASSPAQREDFLASNLASDLSAANRNEISGLLRDLHDESGGIDVVKIERIGRGRFVTARARNHPRLTLINVAPSPAQPSRLATIEVLKSWNPKSDSIKWPARALGNGRAVAQVIGRNVQTLADAGAFSRVVMVAKGDRVVFLQGGMQHTGSFAIDDVVPHRVVGYRHRDNDPLAAKPVYGNRSFVGRSSPAGGEYTTAEDLRLFVRALVSGRLLDPAVRDSLWTGRSPLPWDKSQVYGYGVIVSDVGGHKVLGHGGGGSGSEIDNEVRFFADGSYTVIVLSNMDPPAAADLAPALVKFLAAENR